MSLSTVAAAGRLRASRPTRMLLGHDHACHGADARARVIQMPPLPRLLAHASRTILTASVLPTALFYVVLSTIGFSAAVSATLAWYYLGIAWQLARRRRVLGAVVLGAALLTLRTVTVLLTGSAFLYWLQPVAGTVLTATTIAITSLAGRPLIDRLAHDFCPLPADLTLELRQRRFFDWASLIWSLMYGVNAVGTLWLLTSASMGSFLVGKSVLGPLLTTLAGVGTYVLFRVLVRREEMVICWARHDSEPTPVPAAPQPVSKAA